MADILVPRPAATVMPLRDAPDGFEVLMLRRNLDSDFVGGAYVFPGGSLDRGDAKLARDALVRGPSDAEASSRLGLAEGGLAYLVAAAREMFEESGLLLVCDRDGAPVDLDADAASRVADARRAINEWRGGLGTLLAREGWQLDVRGLAYVAHWVTPVGPPRRFDTRFFAVRAPLDQEATQDDGETVAARWVRPREALAAHERGELDMIFPTIRNLRALAGLASVEEVFAHVAAQTSIPRIEPRIVRRGDEVIILAPGDAGFDS